MQIGSKLLIFLSCMGLWPPFLAALEVHGHRGARSVLPENSLPAFEYALEVGADVLELDMVPTKDGHLAVYHDLHLNPSICTKADGQPIEDGVAIRDMSLARLQTFDCGRKGNERFPRQKKVPGTKIPSLTEVFELVKKSKHPRAKIVKFNIETKTVPGRPELSLAPRAYAKLVIDRVKAAGLMSRVILQSFDHQVLRAAKELAPKIETAALFSGNRPEDFVPIAKQIGASIVSPNQFWITKGDVLRIQKAGLQVIPWTANTPEEWRRLQELGVDGIITDDPGELLSFLGRRKAK